MGRSKKKTKEEKLELLLYFHCCARTREGVEISTFLRKYGLNGHKVEAAYVRRLGPSRVRGKFNTKHIMWIQQQQLETQYLEELGASVPHCGHISVIRSKVIPASE
jgi:hypothetical protein